MQSTVTKDNKNASVATTSTQSTVTKDNKGASVATTSMQSTVTKDNKGARSKVNKQDVIILQPILSYIVFSMQSGSTEKIKQAVCGHFSGEAISEAKSKLWDYGDLSVINERKNRQDTKIRTQREADTMDIISALQKLDSVGKMPMIACNAMSLGLIPKSHPEELNNISLVDRLQRMEYRLTQIQEGLDIVKAENMVLKEENVVINDKFKSNSICSDNTYSKVLQSTS